MNNQKRERGGKGKWRNGKAYRENYQWQLHAKASHIVAEESD
jgi:hypothetical protein